MAMINFAKSKAVLANFLDERMMPALGDDNSFLKWTLAGSSALVLTRLDSIADKYTPILQEFGLMDQSKNLNTDAVKLFINSAFEKQPTVKINLMGVPFKFDVEDGKALIEIMARYEE